MNLAELGPLAEVEVRLPGHDMRYQITRPTDIDRLIDAMEHDPEEVLPHWAEIWPSGVALASEILAEPALVRGQRVLELGCGLGVTASAALQAGADLIVTDYATGALDLCRVNALANAGRTPLILQLNWRKPGDEFLRLAGDGFPVVLAADVLYEARDIEPLLALTEWIVAPGGLLWLAEPGRPIAREFVSRVEAGGWHSDRRTLHGPWPDERDGAIRVTVYRLSRPGRDGRG
jgi:predicted nicotinamide N-methyase